MRKLGQVGIKKETIIEEVLAQEFVKNKLTISSSVYSAYDGFF